MTKEERAYALLLKWENEPQKCDELDCFNIDGENRSCPFADFCSEAREIVKEESRWHKEECLQKQ